MDLDPAAQLVQQLLDDPSSSLELHSLQPQLQTICPEPKSLKDFLLADDVLCVVVPHPAKTKTEPSTESTAASPLVGAAFSQTPLPSLTPRRHRMQTPMSAAQRLRRSQRRRALQAPEDFDSEEDNPFDIEEDGGVDGWNGCDPGRRTGSGLAGQTADDFDGRKKDHDIHTVYNQLLEAWEDMDDGSSDNE